MLKADAMAGWAGRATRAIAAAAIAVSMLASCGGGDQYQPFAPTRLLSFGDEASVITDSGTKYALNALNTAGTAIDCNNDVLWTQYLGAHYGLVFPQCNPNGVGTSSRIYASLGAKAADVEAQINSHLAGGGSFGAKDLVTVLAGANDVIAQFERSGATEADMTAVLQAAGAGLAAQINRIANAGGKVLVSLVPDMGLTPYAVDKEASAAGSAALLSRLTVAFNSAMREKLLNDGRYIGLLLTNELLQSIVANPSTYGFNNVTQAACASPATADLLTCTTSTLVSGADSGTWLWAGSVQLAPNGHARLGTLAVTRATGNPF